MLYIIYADISSLILKKIDGCTNYPENSSTTEIGEHNPCGYLIPTIWAFDHIENKHTLYCIKNCMENFCESLGEHKKNVINFENKKMSLLTKEELKSHQVAKVCVIFAEKQS